MTSNEDKQEKEKNKKVLARLLASTTMCGLSNTSTHPRPEPYKLQSIKDALKYHMRQHIIEETPVYYQYEKGMLSNVNAKTSNFFWTIPQTTF